MNMRQLSRSFCALAVAAVALVVVSCGSSSGNAVTANSLSRDASTGADAWGSFGSEGGTGCTPKACSDLGYTCGKNADGCGGTVDCGSCTAPAFCGGGGFSKCGGSILNGSDGGPLCTPATCSSLHYNCGPSADGCGGLLQCGSCSGAQFCGGGGFNVCGLGDGGVAGDGGPLCTPTSTCTSLGYDCGVAGDGCGALLQCGGANACSGSQFCGGGGFNKCGGSTGLGADGGPTSTCVPATCASLGYTCGFAGDGCGGMLQCGSCAAPQFCGGGGFNQCGGNSGLGSDGGPISSCTPATCQSLGYTCGSGGDGCGGTLQCGSCTAPQFCGGGGFNKCGGNSGVGPDGGAVSSCIPGTCATLGYNCGTAGDGCGGTVQCGSCTSPAYCGGGGFNVCGGNNGQTPDGAPFCAPKTCQQLGFNCGPAGDGCGGVINSCGSCTGSDMCGGGGQPGVCGNAPNCTGLCLQQQSCDGGTPTSITGRVVAGTTGGYGTPDPVPNVLVYVPNAALQAIPNGVTLGTTMCPSCDVDVSGSPLVSTKTKFDGTFTLTNVPVGTGIPLVIQLGRWRRGVYVDVTTACAPKMVGDIHMPRTQAGDMGDIPGSGNIPLTAVSTGEADPIECVLLKMGVDSSEFSSSGSARVHLYNGNSVSTANGATTSAETTLMAGGGTFANYDELLFPCWGYAATKTATEKSNLISYAQSGGRFFATHFSYSWIHGNGVFNGTANWDLDFADVAQETGNVSTTVPASAPGSFAQWLGAVNALSKVSPPQITIDVIRHDVDSVAGTGVDWIDGTDNACQNKNELLHYTFDNTCGHAIFSDFHVNKGTGANLNMCGVQNCGGCTQNVAFPDECGSPTALTAQERVLEFMIWDLSSCPGGGGNTPSCTPRTCAQLNIGCGPAGDGCGGQIAGGCGGCPTGQSCGGGGVPSQCGAPDGGSCTPKTCQQENISCGPAGDGCGNLISGGCGSCPAGQTCGGGGVAGQCGATDGGVCVPRTCQQQAISCGPAGDGCGNLISGGCGSCPAGQTCGGGGVAGQCGGVDAGACVPQTCQQQGIACGPAGDGCGNSIAGGCGSCPTGQTCGGGGVPGQCGSSADGGACVPQSCAQQNIACGPAGDGCGNSIAGGCGTCNPPQTCGGGGVPGQCGGGGSCTPLTCQQQGIMCGPAGDGCGNLISGGCGTCAPPQTCGGGGTPGQCGGGGSCMPLTCAKLNFNCGQTGDGCGGLLNCGTCNSGQTCGGGGIPGQCGGGTQ